MVERWNRWKNSPQVGCLVADMALPTGPPIKTAPTRNKDLSRVISHLLVPQQGLTDWGAPLGGPWYDPFLQTNPLCMLVGLFHSTCLHKMNRITVPNPTNPLKSSFFLSQPSSHQIRIALQVDGAQKSDLYMLSIYYLSRIPKKRSYKQVLFFCVKGISEPKILSRYRVCKHHKVVIVLFFWLAVMRFKFEANK